MLNASPDGLKSIFSHGWVIAILVVFGIFIFFLFIREYDFDKNKKVEYVRPKEMEVFAREDSIVYFIDGSEEGRAYTEIKWLNTNNIYWKVEYYKSRTNKELVVRRIN